MDWSDVIPSENDLFFYVSVCKLVSLCPWIGQAVHVFARGLASLYIDMSVCPFRNWSVCLSVRVFLSANAVCVCEAWFAYHIYVYKVLGSAALVWQGQPRQYSI